MKRHLLYFSLMVLVCMAILGFNYPHSYYLNEPIFMNALTSADLSDGKAGLKSVAHDTMHHNIFHLKLKNNNLHNILFKFNLFSKGYISLDAQDEYIAVADGNGQMSRMIHWDKTYGTIGEVVSDTRSNIYIHSMNKDVFNAHVLREYIVKISEGSDALVPIVRNDYGDNWPNGSGNIRELQPYGSGIAFYQYPVQEGSLTLYRYTDHLEQAMVTSVPKGTFLDDIVGAEPGRIFYTTGQSELGVIQKDGSLNLIRNYLSDGVVLDTMVTLEDQPYVQLKTGSMDRIDNRGGVYSTTQVTSSEDETKAYINLHSGVKDAVPAVYYSWSRSFHKYMTLGLYVLALVVFVYSLRFMYVYIFQRRILLITKMLLILIPLIVAAVLGTVFLVMTDQIVNFSDDIRKGKMMEFDQIMKAELGLIRSGNGADYLPTLLEGMTPYKLIPTEDYAHIQYNVSLDRLLTKKTGVDSDVYEDLHGMYLVMDLVRDGQDYKVIDSDNHFRIFEQRTDARTYAYINRAMAGEEVYAYDEGLGYIFALHPIKNQQNQVVGILQIGMDYNGYKTVNDMRLMGMVLTSLTVIPAIFLPLMVVFTYLMMRPIGMLTREVKKISDKNLNADIAIHTRDEIEDLADAFNQMTSYISEYIGEIKLMSESYHRFVPQEVFRLLNKDRVDEIRLGDNERLDATILCAGINKFYEVTEHLGQEESFNLINQHLKIIGPIIRRHGGIVDRYLDIGIVAMFPDGTDTAVQAAIEIQKKIQSLRTGEDSSYKEIDIAIHKGEILVGIIGEEKRIQSNNVSDIVSLCMLLQSKAAVLASRILISRGAFDELSESYHHRMLGRVRPEGRRNGVEVVDIFDGDPEREFRLKEMSSTFFSRAVGSFVEGEYNRARTDFVRVLEKNINDSVARLYFYETDRRIGESERGEVEELTI